MQIPIDGADALIAQSVRLCKLAVLALLVMLSTIQANLLATLPYRVY
jgi:hypothetical protein